MYVMLHFVKVYAAWIYLVRALFEPSLLSEAVEVLRRERQNCKCLGFTVLGLGFGP